MPETEQSLGPITPANKENGDFSLDLSSPLTVVKKVPKALIFDSNTNQNQDPLTNIDSSSSPRTPKDGVFDPFAPGPEDKAWAPQCKKYSDEARSSVARRLNFSSSFKGLGDECAGDCVESISDEQMFESVYENLLEAIVSKQTECSLAELSKMELDSDSCLTPSSAPRLTGVADACPGAPMKPTGNFSCLTKINVVVDVKIIDKLVDKGVVMSKRTGYSILSTFVEAFFLCIFKFLMSKAHLCIQLHRRTFHCAAKVPPYFATT
ncbi:conserved hypothetical protein [Ricinus communis]|uniref:Uncharacterized protein n=1 Tax=Ricinus communis TaxID=3988 RepID=B9T0Q1_RICCO|nr:conserved hypothetical protein [Ricinus communis]